MEKKRILVVDDELIIQKVITEELMIAGFDVEVAGNGLEAMDRIKHANFKYDLILLDNQMPKATGLEVLEFIHTNRYACAVIMMTAYGSINHAVEAMKLGAFDYITKPFKMSEIMEKVRLVLKDTKNGAIVEENDTTFVLGASEQIMKIKDIIDRVKNTKVTVLITGESGTGKGVIAREIHSKGYGRQEPFIHVNCAVLPENLIESELFGHVKGAFTGAAESKQGKFEVAGNGTIFLDEIGLLNHAMQAKLLTVLQEREFQRIGSNQIVKMKARIIAATNADLREQVRLGKFRKDLYYRLNVISICCSPLRDRKGDIQVLVNHFIRRFNRLYDKKIIEIKPEALELLKRHDWPGNVRELENFVERTVAMSLSNTITVKDIEEFVVIDLSTQESQECKQGKSFEGHLEKQEFFAIVEALKRNDGHRERTAKELGISRRTLQYKLKKYNLV